MQTSEDLVFSRASTVQDSEIFRPEWLAFERELGFRPLLLGPTLEDILKQNADMGLAMVEKYTFPPADPHVSTSEESSESGVRLKIYSPPNVRAGQPIVCYFHGGGCVLGSVDEDDGLVSRHAKDTGLIFVSVEYRLAPQHPFPAGFNDCVEAANWCITNAERLGSQPGNVLLMGVSAGATLAVATGLRLIDDKKADQLQGVVACQPFTIHPDALPDEFKHRYRSYDEHSEHTIDTKAAMQTFLGLHNAPKTDPYIFPVWNQRLKDLPCVYLCAAETDTLRDDARALKTLLDRNSVPNRYDEYEKLPHFFFAWPSAHLDAVREEYFQKTASGIKFVVECSVLSPLPLS
ncbi:uncharacterized protein MYCFIDRAFT_42424 [Pseudocercospora fijiensis CIRAD86]|uniref:Alpha/beta hydrolase fold-3 domain-containing protein n=1 Tax=Pseudocercospora fijiensis (strain CIRAD86) TaxID=383855 RepID=M3AJC8_PSEFD|nr:uncharacterized protein MYCFIDRAFT_42424 [Pseudocercospora fijiensis CIRAD86]EME77263.1 hypothetical protein MYCFIDRAFT_42424 [Pseudocercospora fijiensis CIRAD86]